MDIIYWLIPLSLIILSIAVAIFFWAVRSGQFQDLESPGVDILFEDDVIPIAKSQSGSTAQPKNSKNH